MLFFLLLRFHFLFEVFTKILSLFNRFGLTEEQITAIDPEKLFQVKRKKRLALEERYREQESRVRLSHAILPHTSLTSPLTYIRVLLLAGAEGRI
jgi:hypothetical protein